MANKLLNRQRIQTAAQNAIVKGEELSFSSLAKKLGTRSQALYNYFPNVEALKIALADDFYQRFYENIEIALLGMQGEDAVVRMALFSRQYGLKNYAVIRMIQSIPAEKLRKTSVQQANINRYRGLFQRLLSYLKLDSAQELVVSRALRNLIVGEVNNVGSGWFIDDTISAEASFKKMIISLLHNSATNHE